MTDDNKSFIDCWSEKYTDVKVHRILSLDGGGILGIISLMILKKLEDDLKIATGQGDKFRLGDYFHLIGGTSTGSIIAAGLSIGMTVDEIIGFYKNSGSQMFQKHRFFRRFWSKHKSEPLAQLLRETFEIKPKHDRTLGAKDLKCLFGAVLQNSSTNSTWLVSNNPYSKYNALNHPTCNLKVPLWQIVRASTAAPTFFDPEEINLNTQKPDKPFYFVDGGVTPHNNPAFALYRLATAPEYGLNWKTGEDKMLLISIGTSSFSLGETKNISKGRSLLRTAKNTPAEMIGVMAEDQDLNCRFVGKCVYGPQVNREVGTMMISPATKAGRKFTYARYNPNVDKEGLIDLGLPNYRTDDFKQMDDTTHLDKMQVVGKAYASKYFDITPFGNLI